MLEMRQMIEQACLPDRCEVSCLDGVLMLKLYLQSEGVPYHVLLTLGFHLVQEESDVPHIIE